MPDGRLERFDSRFYFGLRRVRYAIAQHYTPSRRDLGLYGVESQDCEAIATKSRDGSLFRFDLLLLGLAFRLSGSLMPGV